jgi:hypothetical protein
MSTAVSAVSIVIMSKVVISEEFVSIVVVSILDKWRADWLVNYTVKSFVTFVCQKIVMWQVFLVQYGTTGRIFNQSRLLQKLFQKKFERILFPVFLEPGTFTIKSYELVIYGKWTDFVVS